MKNPLGARMDFRRDGTLKQYWKARLELHHFDNYRGRQMSKMPEDLRTYEHVIFATQPKVIVELGAGSTGGSGLWFADRMLTMYGGGRVISIDIAAPTTDGIIDRPGIEHHYINGDLTDPVIAARVADLVDGDPAMVIEDSRHDYHTTLEALRHYSKLVPKGHFFVVEDTIIDDAEMTIFGDHGVVPAIDAFLKEESRFMRRNDLDNLYGITMHAGGWLEALA